MESEELTALGVDLVESATRKCARFRLLGGVAVAILCTDSFVSAPMLRRAPNDIDLAGYSHQSGVIEQILAHRGLTAAKEFNFLNAGRRLLYYRQDDSVKIDIFLDEFRMCHRLALAGRLELAPRTLSITDLLLTKLQVVKLTKKDMMDIYAILLHANQHLRGNSETWIDVNHVVQLCSRDWGWYTTVSMNLQLLKSLAVSTFKGAPPPAIPLTLNELTDSLSGSTKRFGWWLRSLIGQRIRWYEVPETSGEYDQRGCR